MTTLEPWAKKQIGPAEKKQKGNTLVWRAHDSPARKNASSNGKKQRGFVLTLTALLLVLALLTLLNDSWEGQSNLAEKNAALTAHQRLNDRFTQLENTFHELAPGDTRQRDVQQRVFPFDYEINGRELTVRMRVRTTDSDLNRFYNTINWYAAFTTDDNVTGSFITGAQIPKNTTWGASQTDGNFRFSILPTCTRMVINQKPYAAFPVNEIYFEIDPDQNRPGTNTRCDANASANLWDSFLRDAYVDYRMYTTYNTAPNYQATGVAALAGSANENYNPGGAYTNYVSIAFLDGYANDSTIDTFRKNFSGGFPSTWGQREFKKALPVPPANQTFIVYMDKKAPALRLRAPPDSATYGDGEATLKLVFRRDVTAMIFNDFRLRASDPGIGYER